MVSVSFYHQFNGFNSPYNNMEAEVAYLHHTTRSLIIEKPARRSGGSRMKAILQSYSCGEISTILL